MGRRTIVSIVAVGAAGCTLLNSFDGYVAESPAEEGGASSSSSSSSSSGAPSSSSSGTLVGLTDAAPPVVTPDATTDAGSVCPPSPDPALLAFYRFEEGKGSTAIDCSGKGNHGKITGTGAFKPGKVGGGLFFDGTSTCIDIGADKGAGMNAITVAAWVNVVDYAYLSTARYIVAKSTDADLRGWRFGSEASGAFGGKVGRATGGPFGVVTPIGSPNNAWLFVAMAYAANGATTIWIDGNKAATGAAAPPVIEDTVAHLRVGCFTNSTGEQSYHFSGTMDEVRIYSRALSDTELTALR